MKKDTKYFGGVVALVAGVTLVSFGHGSLIMSISGGFVIGLSYGWAYYVGGIR